MGKLSIDTSGVLKIHKRWYSRHHTVLQRTGPSWLVPHDPTCTPDPVHVGRWRRIPPCSLILMWLQCKHIHAKTDSSSSLNVRSTYNIQYIHSYIYMKSEPLLLFCVEVMFFSPPHRRETHEYNILMVKAIRPWKKHIKVPSQQK